MKILFIVDKFLPENVGGAVSVTFNLASTLIKRNHNVLILSTTHDPDQVGDLEIKGIKVKKLLAKNFGKFRNWKNLKNRSLLKEVETVLEQFKPDIVHIHSLHLRFSYGIINLAKEFSRAVVFTLHDVQTIYNGKIYPKRKICIVDYKIDYKITWVDRLKKDGLAYNPFQRFFIKRALRKANKIFAVSIALKQALQVNGISNVEVIHNGLDLKEWSISEFQNNIILFVGRVDEAKGSLVLVRIFNQIKSEIPDAKMVIVGDKDFNPGKNQSIEILPWLNSSEIKEKYKEAKIVVVPSIYLDPFPTVNLEAMACARSVVGTCFGGTPEIVINNETGYIVNPYNEKELAEKIIDLLKNSKKARAFGQAGYRRVKEKFSSEDMASAYLSWYQKLI